MQETGGKGLALAIIDHGRVQYVQAYGVRNAAGEPLRTDTVRTEAGFAKLVSFILGDTGVAYEWEYGDRAGKSD